MKSSNRRVRSSGTSFMKSRRSSLASSRWWSGSARNVDGRSRASRRCSWAGKDPLREYASQYDGGPASNHPDLLPADILGTLIYNPRTGEFTPKKGQFSPTLSSRTKSIVPPPVQSALLEAMQERRSPSVIRPILEQPFIVMATPTPSTRKERTLFLKLK